MIKILDLGLTSGGRLSNIFDPWNPEVFQYDSAKHMYENLQGINLVLFSGGTDVNPKLYGHANIASGYPDDKRDKFERDVFAVAQDLEIPRVGVCRGNQFLCVMNGGWLVQDLDGHGGVHIVDLFQDPDRNSILTNSTHHQMVVPNQHAQILGATVKRSAKYVFDSEAVFNQRRGKQLLPACDPEIVLYSQRDLGFQFHPEYYESDHGVPTLVRKYVNRYLRVGEYR